VQYEYSMICIRYQVLKVRSNDVVMWIYDTDIGPSLVDIPFPLINMAASIVCSMRGFLRCASYRSRYLIFMNAKRYVHFSIIANLLICVTNCFAE